MLAYRQTLIETEGRRDYGHHGQEGTSMSHAIARALRNLAVLSGLLIVTACGGSAPVSSTVNSWQLTDVSVRFGPDISRTATGDEFGSNFVWNGFNEGNRKRQVVSLFQSAMREVGAETMTGGNPVRMNVVVTYFHALTDESRIWCCGEHRIYADLSVVDAATGAVLAQGNEVYLGRLALGGIPGLVAVAAGRDQVVRVREGIVNGTREWLSQY